MDLDERIYRLTNVFPATEKFGLVHLWERCAPISRCPIAGGFAEDAAVRNAYLFAIV